MNARNALWLAALPIAAAGFASSIALAGHPVAPKTVIVRAAYKQSLKKTVLVAPSGLTLYHNTTEKNGRVRCGKGCTSAWPPLLVPAGAKPRAGAGVAQAKLGTIKRPDGGTQVTYAGMLLYRFSADTKTTEAKGQGLGGVWFAIPTTAAAAPPATTAPPPTTTASTTPTDTGGYGY